MKKAGKNRKNLAIILAFLVILSGIPQNGISISRAAENVNNGYGIVSGEDGTVSDGDGTVSGGDGTVSGGDSNKKYTVSWNLSGGGTIEIEGEAITENRVEVKSGSDLSFKIIPDPEYQIKSVYVNKKSVNYVSSNDEGSYYQYTLYDISKDINLSVSFIEIPTLADKISFDSLNLKIINDYGESLSLENKSICYANSQIRICSEDNYVYRLDVDKKYESEIEPEEENHTISYIYRRYKNSNKFGAEEKIIFEDPISIVMDRTAPEISTDEIVWVNKKNDIHLYAEAEDEHPDHMVWSWDKEEKESEITDGKSEICGVSIKDNRSIITVYAVDKAGNRSRPVEIMVCCDDAAPEITDIKIDSPSGVNKQEYGNFSKSFVTLNIAAHDIGTGGISTDGADGADSIEADGVVSAADTASGVKNAEVYAGLTDEQEEKAYVGEYSQESGIVTIEIPLGENEYFYRPEEVRVRVKDIAGNYSEYYTLSEFKDSNDVLSDVLLIEDKSPSVVGNVSDGGRVKKVDGEEQYWHTEIPDIRYTAEDIGGSGLAGYKVFLNDQCVKETEYDYTAADSCDDIIFEDEVILDEEVLADVLPGRNTVTMSFQDTAGNVGMEGEQKVIYIDTKDPEITGYSIEASDKNSKINKFNFGNFSNGVVKITVFATDEYEDETGQRIEGSGVKSITLHVGGGTIKKAVTDGKSATFELPSDTIANIEKIYLNEIIQASVEDWSGRTSKLCGINFKNEDIKSDRLTIESVMPAAEMSIAEGNVIYQSGGKTYFGDNLKLAVKAADRESGLWRVSVRVAGNNSSLYEKDYSTGSKEKCIEDDSVIVNLSEAGSVDENIYKVAVSVMDNSGNENSFSTVFYKDVTAPQIVAYEMMSGEEDTYVKDEFSVVETGYGYYFRDNTRVRIYASDGSGEADCGVMEIQYYTINSEGFRSEIKTERVRKDSEGDSYIELNIEEDFRGQIYACAFDNLMNHTDEFISPRGVIVDTPQSHAAETHIQLQVPEAAAADGEGHSLYAGDVNVSVTVTDKISGIQSVEWFVDAPNDSGNNQSGYIEIGNEGGFENDSDGWEIVNTDKNLVTEIQKNILVSANSNNIKIFFEMRDRAGNVSQEEMVFGIDKTVPVIEVVFDNNTPDQEYREIYNNERTATITVKERNFIGSGVTAEITNSEGVIPEMSDWSTQVDEGNPDNTISTATIKFSADGDYTLEISGWDAVHNTAEPVRADKFTIDKTSPKIEVNFNNNNSMNENYYSSERTASISITEHNFAPERVTIKGTVTNAGQEGNFPAIGGWSRSGDVYTAHLICADDGLYNFEVEYSDKAGNTGEKFVSEPYHVDKTAPVIDISGVGAYSANNGDVIPQISLSDINYDVNGVDIQLIGANNGIIIPEGEFSSQGSGQIYKFNNFPRELSYDDMYTINVTLRDLAGNETTDSITFSVNRFGSVYIFDESLKRISGTYIREEIDVKLTEVNIDSLEHDSIKIVVDANGTLKDLVEGQDYTVRQSGDDGTWYKYDYDIDSSLFAGDGRYIVTLYSEDEAGNINQNIDETKQAEISFGVDKTAPVIIPIDVESGVQYPVDVKSATVAVNDNLILDNVVIYVDSKRCEYVVNGENYIFDIPSADQQQTITIVATDLAGNVTQYVIEDILVTTNLLIRWYNNKPLFAGTLAGTVTACGGGIGLAAFFRRRRIKMVR